MLKNVNDSRTHKNETFVKLKFMSFVLLMMKMQNHEELQGINMFAMQGFVLDFKVKTLLVM